MVEIVTGNGLGLERTSGLLLGGAGTIGSSATGTAGVAAVVNATTGNLVLQSVGEVLDGIGYRDDENAIVNQTYNSLGMLNGTNNTTWAAQGAQIVNQTGTVNTAGSTVQRIGWDGSLVTYSYNTSFKNADGTTGAYVAKEASGTYDSITFTSGTWYWHNGSTGVIETYGNPGNRISLSTDLGSDTLTFTYTGNLLTQIKTFDGEYVTLGYSGNNLTQLTTHLSSGATLTRTYYSYDSQNRLTSTIVDLSPTDNSTTDGQVYTTTYTYVGTSNLVSSVKQTDGSEIDFTYDTSNRVSTITQWVNATTSRTTTFAYGSGSTTVTDPQSNQTVLRYDANGNLLSIAYPAVSGGNAEYKSFTYDASGNLLTESVYANVGGAPSGSPLSQVTNTYDQNGNLLTTVDLAGDTTSYTYNQFNSVLTRTVYTNPAVGATPASGPETTFYAYGVKGALRFIVSPAGDVTYFLTNSAGQTMSTIRYTTKQYNMTGLTAATPISVTALQSWQAGLTAADNQAIERTDYAYDVRGNLVYAKSFSATDASGNGLTTSPYTQTTYVYDQAGNLLSKLVNDGSSAAETYVYDGLGRITLQTDGAGNNMSTVYNNAANSATTTYANGLVVTQTFDKAGELTGTTDTGSSIATTTSSYLYDSLGNLRVSTDPAGTNTYYFYDADQRKVGQVDGAGYLTEFKYDAENRLVATVVFATPLTSAQLASLAPSGGAPSSVTLTSVQPATAPTDNWNWRVYDNAGRLSETINAIGAVTTFGYDGTGALIQQTSYANTLTSAQIATLQSSPPTTQVLPVANAAQDRTTRNFYNVDGLLIGTLDPKGYLSQVDYDDAGRKVDAVQYATQASASLLATGTFAQLQASVGTSVKDQHSYYLYDDRGLLIASIDPVGDVTRYTYTAKGEIATEVTGQQVTPNTAYTLATLPAASGATETTAYTYDGDGRVKTITRGQGTPQQAVTQYSYDAAGNVIQTIDARNYTDTVSYDALGRVLNTSVAIDGNTADNIVTQYTYDTRGNKTSETDPRGKVSYFYYDNDDRLTLAVDPDGYATATTYSGNSNRVATVTHYALPIGEVSLALASGSTLYAGQSVHSSDNRFQLSYQTDGNLVLYGPSGALWASNTGGTTTGHVSMQSDGNLVVYNGSGAAVWASNTGSSGAALFFTGNGELEIFAASGSILLGTSSWSTPANSTPDVAFDSATTRPVIATSTGDAVTSFSYDAAGRLVGTTDALGGSEAYVLNSFGERTQLTSKKAAVTTYQYDQRGQLTQETMVGEASILASGAEATSISNTYAYDAFGNRVQQVEAAGLSEARTTVYAYDNLNRLTSQSLWLSANGSIAATTQYQYDGNGNVVLTTDPNGHKTFDYYDALNRKAAEVNALGVLTSWTYDGNGNVTAQRVYATPLAIASLSVGGTPPAGSGASREIDYTYDGNNRLTKTTVLNVTTGQWNGSSYVTTTGNLITSQTVYDPAGNVVQTIDANNVSTYFYYDAAGRKIAQVDGDGYLTIDVNDANGNVVQETRYATQINVASLGTTYGVPAAKLTLTQLASAAGASASDRITQFTYDRNGERLTETRLNVAIATASTSSDAITQSTANATVTYVYNPLGEVKSKTEATGDTTTYAYDTFGRMTSTTNATGETTAYHYDGLNNVTQAISSGTGSATRVTNYVYGAGGRLASMAGPGVNAAETVLTTSYSYDLAGNLTLQSQIRNAANAASGTVDFKTAINYDALNRAYSEQSSYLSGGSWVAGDTNGMIYDAYGEVAAVTVNGTRTTQSIYDNAGHLVASNSGDGTWKAYVTDGNGNATLTIESLASLGTTDLSSFITPGSAGGLDTSSYNQAGALALATNNGANTAGAAVGNGVAVTIGVFDGRNQRLQTLQPQRTIDSTGALHTITTSTSYDAFGDVASQTDARGYTTTFTYNTEGMGTARISPQVTIASGNGSTALGNPTQYQYYDLSGRLVATRDADGNLITRTLLAGTGYNGAKALETAEYHPDGGVIHNSYDVYGDVLTQTDALGYVTTNSYDNSGDLIQVKHPQRSTNTDGTTGDGSQLINYYSYDGLGEQVGQWNSLLTNGGGAAVQSTAFDAQGRVISTTDLAGHVINYSYSWSGSAATSGLATYGGWTKTTTDVDAGVTSSATTDAFGHQIGETDAGGHVYAFTFNKAGELVGQTSSTTSQSVTTNGATSSVSTGGESLAYTYYGDGRVATIVDNSAGISAYYTGNVTSTFSYDVAGNRLTSNYTSTSTYSGYVYGHYYSGTSTTVLENSTASYDALGRVVSVSDPGGTSRPSFTQTKSYDANGNIIENNTVHQNLATDQTLTANTTDDYWYAYDSMNRVVVSKGELSGAAGAAGTTVIADARSGTAITYNAAGEEATSTTYGMAVVTLDLGQYGSIDYPYTQTTEEVFAYTADGYLATASVAQNYGTLTGSGNTLHATPGPLGSPQLQARDSRDALGRVTQHTEYNTTTMNTSAMLGAPGSAIYSQSYSYNNDSQITSSQVSVVQYNSSTGNVTNSVTNTTYSYGTNVAPGGTRGATSYADGDVVSQTATTTTYQGATGTSSPSTTTISTSNSYLWFDGAVQGSITSVYSGAQSGTTTSTFNYDHNGHVSQVATTGTNAHTNNYTTSAAGLVMANEEISTASSTSAPETFYFYLNDRLIGQIGNDGTTNTNYTTSIYNQTSTSNGTGAFAQNGSTGTPSADFDQNYQAINATGNGEAPAGSSYTVVGGDTLSGIAQKVFGDANLWYVIANANGLSFGSSLAAGEQLSIPNVVVNTGNTASTFKPYNPNAALGDVQPGAPIPPAAHGGGCGGLGAILGTIIAVAVAILLPPVGGPLGILEAAAEGVGSNLLGQGIAVAAGAQQSINWSSVALSGLSAGVTKGIGEAGIFDDIASPLLQDGLTGITSSILTQGIGVATGLQSRFDWAGVAAAGVGAVAAGAALRSFTGDPYLSGGGRNPEYIPATAGQQIVSGMAGSVASAATRSVVTGTDFGDNLIATLPQVIGNTIGNLAASEIAGSPEPTSSAGGGSTAQPATTPDGAPINYVSDAQYQQASIDALSNSLLKEAYMKRLISIDQYNAGVIIEGDSSYGPGIVNGYNVDSGPNAGSNQKVIIAPGRLYEFDANGDIGFNQDLGDRHGTFVVLREATAAADRETNNIIYYGVGFGVETAAEAVTGELAIGAVAKGYRLWTGAEGLAISSRTAGTLLRFKGVPADDIASHIGSFEGQISVRLVPKGEEWLRYTDEAEGAGRYLTKTRFADPSSAVEGLWLKPYGNNATLVQDVNSVGRSIVLEGGVANGGSGISQTFITNRQAFSFGLGRVY